MNDTAKLVWTLVAITAAGLLLGGCASEASATSIPQTNTKIITTWGRKDFREVEINGVRCIELYRHYAGGLSCDFRK